MCPVVWAGWLLFVFQCAFALAGTGAMIYLIVSAYRTTRERRKADAAWETTRLEMESKLAAALTSLVRREPRTDA